MMEREGCPGECEEVGGSHRRFWRRVAADSRGMTLIEILAVIVLIGLIMTVVASNVFKQGDTAKAQLNKVRMERVKAALEQYRLQFSRYPGSLQDLLQRPGDLPSDQLYTPFIDTAELKDIWNYDFVYRVEGGGRAFALTSFGADGVAGGDGAKQDITLSP